MIRPATALDVPSMLDIYAPYVRETTITFEYEVPAPDAFQARFAGITEKFPWLVWEERGRILGYAYASAPFERAPTPGAPSPPSTCGRMPGAEESGKGFTRRWRLFYLRWATRSALPSLRGRTGPLWPFIGRLATKNAPKW